MSISQTRNYFLLLSICLWTVCSSRFITCNFFHKYLLSFLVLKFIIFFYKYQYFFCYFYPPFCYFYPPFCYFYPPFCYFYPPILLLIRCSKASHTSHPQPPKRTKKIYKRLVKEYPPDILSRFLTKISRKKQKKKGKFLTKLPRCIFKGQAPFSLRENSPSSKEG